MKSIMMFEPGTRTAIKGSGQRKPPETRFAISAGRSMFTVEKRKHDPIHYYINSLSGTITMAMAMARER